MRAFLAALLGMAATSTAHATGAADPVAPAPDVAPAGAVAAAPGTIVPPGNTTNIYAGDYMVIGIGAALVPPYEGSRGHHVIPAVGLGGRVHGIGLSPRTAGVAFNLIPPRRARVALSLGPVIRYRGAHTVEFTDPTPVRVGAGTGNVELGVAASISIKRLLSSYDTLSLGSDIRWDASHGTGARIIAPSASYTTPVSKGQLVGISANADFINNSYANRNYAAVPVGGGASMAGGAGAGLHSLGTRLFTIYDADHDLRNGGISLLFGAGYTRLIGSATRSPLVQNNGARGQIVIGSGIAVAFH